ncbi:DNA helicase [Maudiozyma humilis]|uniref:ATP-dependent DNA helicase CHL1 n=1 Tax=Maudiozyma humilis TaxID=51915 RepID=A0AAV5RT82_MAUHU|nr:DNA helicase [Kazachstania humilis]
MNEDTNTNRFHHPYVPYSIQEQLMESLYDGALQGGKKVALVESPTGTGKTLSLICATVTWLRDNKSRLLQQAAAPASDTTKTTSSQSNSDSDFSDFSDSSDEPEWVLEGARAATQRETLELLADYEHYLDNLAPPAASATAVVDAAVAHPGGGQRHTGGRASLLANRKYTSQRGNARVNTPAPQKQRRAVGPSAAIADADLLPAEPEEPLAGGSAAKSKLGSEVRDLLEKLHSKERASRDRYGETPEDKYHDASPNPVKIYFASRTHSQLSQFAQQLNLPKFPSSFDTEVVPLERIKFLPLGSKKQLCIEPSVKRWGTLEAINDACYDLRHSKNGCPFYKNSPQWHRSDDTVAFRDNLYKEVHDIEDLVPLGESLKVCPYYASRDALVGAEIVSLPYQYLLSDTARESLGIDLKGAIVIVDEAHNLIDTVNSIYSAAVTFPDVESVIGGLGAYLAKFQQRLGPRNRVNLQKLMALLTTLRGFMDATYKKPGQRVESYDILGGSNADMLNIHKLIDYINKSKVAYKIDTYMTRLKETEATAATTTTTTAPEQPRKGRQPLLFKVMAFLSTLTNPSHEGQYFFEKDKELRYMLLEPGKVVEPLIRDTRCLILAGGTMEPVADFYNELFPQLSRDDIATFSCNHVIPDANLDTFIVSDPQFEFTFAKRNAPDLINGDLFQFYDKLASTVPLKGGIVGFYPSYQYLKVVMDSWKAAGLFDKLNGKRQIFYETKNGGDILSDYIKAVSKGKGAILFAIVGGKLSEGINFQDDLCRAVVMTGLPFPNVFSGELQIKTSHLESKIIAAGGSKQDAMKATREFYENICMKAVNQSVGRAIRHANDYAAIYLLDKRYNTENIKQKLSLWVRKRIQNEQSVPGVLNATRLFFNTFERKQ